MQNALVSRLLQDLSIVMPEVEIMDKVKDKPCT